MCRFKFCTDGFQDISKNKNGAFTGEVSGNDTFFGVKYTILGHSEKARVF